MTCQVYLTGKFYLSRIQASGTLTQTVNMLHNYSCTLTDGVGYNAIATLILSCDQHILPMPQGLQLYIVDNINIISDSSDFSPQLKINITISNW